MKDTNMRAFVTTMIFALLTHAIPAWSASFDCSKASTDAEIAICNDPELSSLDELMGDIFSNLDKTAYIVIFVSFILGFFMGKTMQPVILRPG